MKLGEILEEFNKSEDAITDGRDIVTGSIAKYPEVHVRLNPELDLLEMIFLSDLYYDSCWERHITSYLIEKSDLLPYLERLIEQEHGSVDLSSSAIRVHRLVRYKTARSLLLGIKYNKNITNFENLDDGHYIRITKGVLSGQLVGRNPCLRYRLDVSMLRFEQQGTEMHFEIFPGKEYIQRINDTISGMKKENIK